MVGGVGIVIGSGESGTRMWRYDLSVAVLENQIGFPNDHFCSETGGSGCPTEGLFINEFPAERGSFTLI
jgi:hypothetical protein